jgi:RHS repeat-associated protein
VASAAYGYDANDRLTSETYDNNGNTRNSGGTAYAYDFENRLVGAGGGAVTYVYDGDGNRVAKTAGGVTTRYLVDDRNPTGYAQVLEEIVGGGVGRVYAYGHSIISQYQPLGGTWTASYYGLDGHGNVRLLTDASGAVTDTYDYDAFGNLIAATGGTPNVYLYTGEQFDPNVGFYYLRARYYSGNVGRFTTMDTYAGCVFDPPSLHKYLYTGNDPVNKTDPSGLMTLAETGTTINLITLATFLALTAIGVCVARLLLSTALVIAGVDTTTVQGPCVARARPCPPCPNPPPPEIDRVPPSRPHFPCPGDHWHYYEYNQNPVTCKCYGPKRIFGGCCGAGDPSAPC